MAATILRDVLRKLPKKPPPGGTTIRIPREYVSEFPDIFEGSVYRWNRGQMINKMIDNLLIGHRYGRPNLTTPRRTDLLKGYRLGTIPAIEVIGPDRYTWAPDLESIQRWLDSQRYEPYATFKRTADGIRVTRGFREHNYSAGNPGGESSTKRRNERKTHKGYTEILAAVTRTYGRMSEWADFISAFTLNDTPESIVGALAMNEAIDHIYGARAKALKTYIYNRDFYKLPVGLDFLASPLYKRSPL